MLLVLNIDTLFLDLSKSRQPGSRRRRSPLNNYDYEDTDYDDDIYALLALDEYDEDNGLEYYDDILPDDAEGSGPEYNHVDIDTATADMAENVNKLLGLENDEQQDKQEEIFSKSKKVNSSSCEITGLDPCTVYLLAVTAVYTNNATITSDQKVFRTDCTAEPPCDQDNLQLDQQIQDSSVQIEFSWQGCQEKYLLQLTCQEDHCEDYSQEGAQQDEQQVKVSFSGLSFCTPYTLELVRKGARIQREVMSIQNPKKKNNLTDFRIEMKSLKEGEDPSSTEGSVTASWVHDQVCVASYSITICDKDKCEKSLQAPGNIGERMEVDVQKITSTIVLKPCQSYQLQVLPIEDAGMSENGVSSIGLVRVFTFIPGYDPPIGGEDMVRSVSTSSVTLAWRPPNICAHVFSVAVFAIKHLPNLREEFIQTEDEPLVYQSLVNHNDTIKQNIEITISTNLTSCQLYRVEVQSVFHDQVQGEIMSEPLVKMFKTLADDRVTIPYMHKEVVPQRIKNTQDVLFQFSDRCSPAYTLHTCLFPDECSTGQGTVYTILENEEQSAMGYYQQLVTDLPSCSVVKWEIVSVSSNVTLLSEYLFTPVAMDQFHLYLTNLSISTEESVSVSWILSQPCVSEYQIHLCTVPSQHCWAGNFSSPEIQSDKDLFIDIKMEELQGFDFAFVECGVYEVTILPSIGENLLDTGVTIPFTFLTQPRPPVVMNITDISDNSFVVSWVNSGCSAGTILVLTRQGEIMEEVTLAEEVREYRVEGLDSCSDYIIELYGRHNGRKSNESQMMLAITNHEGKIPVIINPGHANITVTVGENKTRCVAEYTIEICEAAEDCIEDEDSKCETATIENSKLSHTFSSLHEGTVYSVLVTGRDYQNLTSCKSSLQCCMTNHIVLYPIEITEHNITLGMNAEKDDLYVSLFCVMEGGDDRYENAGYGPQFVFTNLEPDMNYQCGGVASNDIVIQDIIIHTLDQIPQRIESVRITDITSGSFLISWLPPEKVKGKIEKYRLRLTSGCENIKDDKCEPDYSCLESEVIVLSSEVTTYLKHSPPGVSYSVVVGVQTRNPQPGPDSEPVLARTLSDKPYKPVITSIDTVGPGTAIITYNHSCPYTGPVVYDVLYTCHCHPQHFLHTTHTVHSENSFQISRLPQGYDYTIMVEAVAHNCGEHIQDSEEHDHCSTLSAPYPLHIPCVYRCADGSCLDKTSARCDWVAECPDGSDEWNCTCTGFSCENHFCIPESQRCDGIVQCNDGTDEHGCPGCRKDQFTCARSGLCIPGEKACDKILDCWDGSDEKNCPYRKHICWPNKFKCFDGRCIAQSKRCDRVADCAQGEDEQNCEFQCGLDEFTCKDGGCIKQNNVCDDTLDCDDGSDEPEHCHCHLQGEFSCESSGKCIKRHKVCDGTNDCLDKSDEKGCDEKLPRTSYENKFLGTTPLLVLRVNTTDSSPPYFSQYKEYSNEGKYERKEVSKFLHPNSVLYSAPRSNYLELTTPYQTKTTGSSKQNLLKKAQEMKIPKKYSVSVQTYPRRQTVLRGQDVVIQCRDEGSQRRHVFWQREGRRQLPNHSTQENGRLEIHGVTFPDDGDYECIAVGHEEEAGGKQVASLTIMGE